MLIDLSQKVQNELDKDEIDAVVITHGTDTLEETSFFLDLTVDSYKPVIVTGAMYPSTSYSADGPKNLYEAVCVGASPASQNRGVLVVFNGVIMPARYTVKSDANMIATFDPGHQGCLGQVVDDKTLYYWPPARPLGHQHVNIRSLDPKVGFPKVEIVYGRLGVDPGVFEAHIQSGAKGLVLVGMGAGCWSTAGRDQLNEHIGPGRVNDRESTTPFIPVVTSFRAGRGCVSLKEHIFGVPDWVIRAGFLNPPKACKLLEVCLALEMSYHEIEAAFSIDTCSA
jgi:L-asparaginase